MGILGDVTFIIPVTASQSHVGQLFSTFCILSCTSHFIKNLQSTRV